MTSTGNLKTYQDGILQGLVLAALLALGFWLRWQYIRTVSLHVDEFTTMWAATLVQENGVPRTPAGVLYTRGLLNTYVEALFFSLFGNSYTVGRAASLLFGLGSIAVVFAIGRREWNVRVGLLAAAGLTVLPEAIVWSGRARFYSQLQFFALLATWAAFAAVTTKDERRRARLALGLCRALHPRPLFPGRDALALSIHRARHAHLVWLALVSAPGCHRRPGDCAAQHGLPLSD